MSLSAREQFQKHDENFFCLIHPQIFVINFKFSAIFRSREYFDRLISLLLVAAVAVSFLSYSIFWQMSFLNFINIIYSQLILRN
jgi:hypothetical protein